MNSALVSQAAAEYFNEGYMYAEMDRTLKNTEPEHRPQAYESMRPPRTVPDGCFEWIRHLVWLEGLLEVVRLPLTAVETAGLVALKRERRRFQYEHPPCPKCGMPNEKLAFRCRDCNEEIRRL